MKKIRIGIAGCGTTGQMYGPILRYLKTAEVVAFMDPSREAACRIQALGGGEVFTNYDKFLQAGRVEAVIIGSPVWAHQEQVVKAAEAGKHVLCEKPLAPTLEECDTMIKACRKNRVILMAAFMKRFDKNFRLAKEMVDKGTLGEIFQIRCDWSWRQYFTAGWRDRIQTGGGLFQDHGSHTIDLCRWFAGEIETVSAEMAIRLQAREVEDQAVVTLRHKNGCISLHHMLRMTHKPLNEYYLLDGSRASLEMEYGPGWSAFSLKPFKMTLYGGHGLKGITTKSDDITLRNETDEEPEIAKNHRYLKELEHFCECILKDKKPLVGGIDGRKALEVINAAYLSAVRKEKIHLPLKSSPDLDDLFKKIKRESLRVDEKGRKIGPGKR